MSIKSTRNSPSRELSVLIPSAFRSFFSGLGVLVPLFFPLIAGVAIVWVAGEDCYVNAESTRSAIFMIVCANLWCGLFNSISVVTKERGYIRREYMAGVMRIRSYTRSRALVQLILCLFQSLMFCLIFVAIPEVYGNSIPEQGVLFSSDDLGEHSVLVEYYITTFLIVLSADALGFFLSCAVRPGQSASSMTPYVLMLQILLCGMLFDLSGTAAALSQGMICRWGNEALGTISNINELPLRISEEFPMIPHEPEDAFLYTKDHLIKTWLILGAFSILPFFAGNLMLHRVKHDVR